MSDNQNSSEFDSSGLIVFLWKWRKPLLIISLAAAIVSAAVSLMLPEVFKSSAIIFPAKSSTVTLSNKATQTQSPVMIGTEEEAEQLIQILNSAEIRDTIISRYDLMNHYEIEAPYANYKLVQQYNESVICNRTPYGSITVDVYDTEPEVAANIANDIVELVDSVKNRMLRARALEAFVEVERKYNNLRDDIEVINDTIAALKKMGVVSSSVEGYLNDALSKATNQDQIDEFKRKLQVTAEYGHLLNDFANKRELKRDRLSEMEHTYDQAKTDAELKYSQKFLLERATAAERKTYPMRWLIVIISTLASFVLTSLIIIITQKIKVLRENGL